jgi:hypothetical protein
MERRPWSKRRCRNLEQSSPLLLTYPPWRQLQRVQLAAKLVTWAMLSTLFYKVRCRYFLAPKGKILGLGWKTVYAWKQRYCHALWR